MKKSGIIIGLSILMTLMSFSFCFAQGLELLDSYPKDGSSDSRPENFLVKLYFNEDVSGMQTEESNDNAFKFTDSKGKQLPVKVLYDSKRPKEIWVLVNEILESDSSYKLYISGELTNDNGDSLGEDKTINLKTRNLNTDNTVNMVLMGVMMVGMVFFTSISAKRQMKKQTEEAKAEGKEKVNVYKVAKETGKSVEAVVAKTEKQKAKARAQAEKKNQSRVRDEGKSADEKAAQPDMNTRRVTEPRPIAAAGSAYITGRKAIAEREKAMAAAKVAAGTTRPKSATGKSRNKKAKSNKK